jgi:hypothetical protein
MPAQSPAAKRAGRFSTGCAGSRTCECQKNGHESCSIKNCCPARRHPFPAGLHCHGKHEKRGNRNDHFVAHNGSVRSAASFAMGSANTNAANSSRRCPGSAIRKTGRSRSSASGSRAGPTKSRTASRTFLHANSNGPAGRRCCSKTEPCARKRR